jgi:hypothetical protein
MVANDGRINDKILKRLATKDWLAKLEAAYLVCRTEFHSPELKRAYHRFFDVTSRNVHFIQFTCRAKLPHDAVEQAEQHIDKRIAGVIRELDEGLVAAETLLREAALAEPAQYLAPPMKVEARLLSPICRRYLVVLEKADQLLRLLETLQIGAVVPVKNVDIQRALIKRHIRVVANAVRALAGGLRDRMNQASALEEAVLTQTNQIPCPTTEIAVTTPAENLPAPVAS